MGDLSIQHSFRCCNITAPMRIASGSQNILQLGVFAGLARQDAGADLPGSVGLRFRNIQRGFGDTRRSHDGKRLNNFIIDALDRAKLE